MTHQDRLESLRGQHGRYTSREGHAYTNYGVVPAGCEGLATAAERMRHAIDRLDDVIAFYSDDTAWARRLIEERRPRR